MILKKAIRPDVVFSLDAKLLADLIVWIAVEMMNTSLVSNLFANGL
jgi:hypothetical protein